LKFDKETVKELGSRTWKVMRRWSDG